MADKNQKWTTRAGTIKAGSVTAIEGKEALTAIIVNKEGAENIVEAYGEKAMAKLRKAAESSEPVVLRGPFYMKSGVSHFMLSHVVEKGAPEAKAELTEEEKAARAAAAAERKTARDASRVLVDAGSVEIGGKVEKDGVSQEINHIGTAFEKDGKMMAYAYFGEMGLEMAAKAAPQEAAPEVEDETPTP